MAASSKSASLSRSSDQRAPHQCPFCQRTFRKKEHALRHIRSHTKERPFKCGVCNKTYPRSDTLRRHERSHEQDQRVDFEDHQSSTELDGQGHLVSQLADTIAVSGEPVVTEATFHHPSSHTQFDGVRTIDSNTIIHAYRSPQARSSPSVQGYERPENVPGKVHTEFSRANDGPVTRAARASATEESVLDTELSTFAASALYDDSWLLSNDFDIRAMNSALDDTLFEWVQAPLADTGPLPSVRSTLRHHDSLLVPRHGAGHENVVAEPAEPPSGNNVRFMGTPFVDKWYTQLQTEEPSSYTANVPSRASTEEPQSQFNVDERYTANLSKHLRPRQFEETHLSVTFLNECLRLYFARFHPVFPVIHLPSFRPDHNNALLVLSMCSIGSLFMGSHKSNALGHSIYTRLNKAIVAGWETHLSRSAERTFYMLQASLLGQTFGLLSEKPNNVIMTDMFQGTMISWSRRLGKFGRALPELPSSDVDPTEKARAWKHWIGAEQLQRFILAIHIHDAELASLLHHEPVLRHMKLKHDTIISDALFDARTAEEWYSLFNRLRPQIVQSNPTTLETSFVSLSSTWENTIDIRMMNSQYASYAILENINAAIVESRRLGSLDDEQKQRFTQGLLQWVKCYEITVNKEKEDAFALRALWHSCFLNLAVDFDLLECALGREGRSKVAEHTQEVRSWTTSIDAVRCLLHTVALQGFLEGMRINWTPSIHVPRILFNCGTAWICHRYWYSSSDAHTELQAGQLKALAEQFPEVQAQSWVYEQHIDHVASLIGLKATTHYRSTIYGIIEMLQRLNRWSIANTFASILREAASTLFLD